MASPHPAAPDGPMFEAEAGLTVDLDALAANLATLRRNAGGGEVAPVVKADAYGLGLAPVSRRLWAEGARCFFVARLSEAVALRQLLGPERDAIIYVLDGCSEGGGGAMLTHRLVPVLNSLVQVREWTSVARAAGRTLSAALHVDTGLNRLGLRLEEAAALAQASDGLRGVEVELLVSHLACAETPDHPVNERQLALFEQACGLFPGVPVSLAASAGLRLGPRFHGAVVRPGIGLYGAGPHAGARLRPVARLQAPVIQVRSVRPGESVGYGASFVAERPMRVAIVAAGYADGVLRASSRPRYGWFSGAKRAFVGRISMDLIALDVTGCEAWPGAKVELFGVNLPIEDAAADAGTIAYELLTSVSARVPRVYAALAETA